jgi:hypothetical protein
MILPGNKKINLEEKSGSSKQVCYTNGEILKVTPKTNSHKYSFLIKSKTNSHKYFFLTKSKTKDG